MNLLEKFESIGMGQDTRITEEDKVYCETQQQAYIQARVALKEVLSMVEKYTDQEIDTFTAKGYDRTRYFSLEISKVESVFADTHQKFIGSLVSYFMQKYSVTLLSSSICNKLIPQIDRYCDDDNIIEEHKKKLYDLSLNWQQVLDCILAQLDGFSFADKAVNELKGKCHIAAWDTYRGSKCYEQKKMLISFKDGCYWNTLFDTPSITLHNSSKDVIRALSFFETGVLKDVLLDFRDMLSYRFETPEKTFSCIKVSSIKCFKNGRLDIRFTSEEYAREFAEEFLGIEA